MSEMDAQLAELGGRSVADGAAAVLLLVLSGERRCARMPLKSMLSRGRASSGSAPLVVACSSLANLALLGEGLGSVHDSVVQRCAHLWSSPSVRCSSPGGIPMILASSASLSLSTLSLRRTVDVDSDFHESSSYLPLPLAGVRSLSA